MNDIRWTPLANTWIPEDLREQFLEECRASTWKPIEGTHPMSPGLMLQQIIPMLRRDMGMKGFSHVAYSQVWEIREDNHRLEPYVFDGMITAQILGVKSEVNGMCFYLLDIGIGAVPLVLEDLGKRAGDDHKPRPAVMVKPWVGTPDGPPAPQTCCVEGCGRKIVWEGPDADNWEHTHIDVE